MRRKSLCLVFLLLFGLSVFLSNRLLAQRTPLLEIPEATSGLTPEPETVSSTEDAAPVLFIPVAEYFVRVADPRELALLIPLEVPRTGDVAAISETPASATAFASVWVALYFGLGTLLGLLGVYSLFAHFLR